VLVTEAHGANEDRTAYNRIKNRLTAELPAILQLVDSKIGAPFLARHVDPTILIPRGSVVCLDDLDRANQTRLPFADVLGYASTLAERRDCRVLLIYNSEYLTDAAAGPTVELFRERAVRYVLTLTADLDVVARALPNEHAGGPSESERDFVIAALRRARCTNLRTFHRCLRRVVALREGLGAAVTDPHRALVVAFTIEQDEARLQPASFYDFSPLVLSLWASGRFGKPDDSKERIEKTEFFNRHYRDTATEYHFSKALHEFVAQGVLPRSRMLQELEAEGAATTAANALLEPLRSRDLLLFSDAEHHAWLDRLQQQRSVFDTLSANELLSLRVAVSISCDQLGRVTHTQLVAALEDSFVSAGRSGDGSAEQSLVRDPSLAALVARYEGELREHRQAAKAEQLIASIWTRDLEEFKRHLREQDPVRAIASTDLLRELHSLMPADRRFYFGALLALRDELEGRGPADSEVFRTYLVACLCFEAWDNSDQFRLKHLMAKAGD
jgi:hypothetical protein